jgi:hypothetical protein
MDMDQAVGVVVIVTVMPYILAYWLFKSVTGGKV